MKSLIFCSCLVLSFFDCNQKEKGGNTDTEKILQTVINSNEFEKSILNNYKDSILTIVLTSVFNETPLVYWRNHVVRYIDSSEIENYSVLKKIRQKELPSLEVFITKMIISNSTA